MRPRNDICKRDSVKHSLSWFRKEMLPIMPMDADRFGRCSHRLARRVKRGVGTRLLYIMCGANPHRIKSPVSDRIGRRCGIPCRINKNADIGCLTVEHGQVVISGRMILSYIGNRTTDSSSIGRTPTAVLVADGRHRFKSCLSDYSKLGDADRKARPRCLFAGFYYVGSMYHGHA